MFELHLVDLSKDMIDYLKDLIINSECKKIFFISANKRPIRFLEQRLDIDYLLKTDFYVFDDFVKEFVLKHTNDSVLYQSNLERYFFMLDVIRSHNHVYEALGREDKKVFPWAKRLSSLFSEIDKNLPIDTDTLDLSKNLDNIYIEMLKESDTILSNIKTLYNTYRKQMGNQIYGGELYRRMLKLLENVDLTDYEFIFSGLLYLSKLEIEILKKIASKTKVCFVLYSDNHNRNKYFNCFEAVELTVREIERVVKNVNRVISKEDSFMLPEINFYDSSSCMQEMEELSNRLERDFSEINKANEVAVLLPDESVLRLFLTNIPEKIGDNLNITMGYPFVQTNVYGFLIRFLDVIYRAEIQENGFKIDSDILIKLCDFENLIVHDGFKRELIDIKRCIFRQERKNVVLNGGFLYNLICQFKENVTLEKWRSLFENLLSYLIRSVYDEKDLSFILNANIALLFIDEISAKIEGVKDRYVDIEFLISIIKEIAKDIFIPFEGSPLKGLQVMGMLESRGLKFDTLFILDVNEGILPNYDKVDPLLPEMVKRYLGLPTYKEKELLMRYNFFRAVYSAKKVFLFYRSGEEKGEKYTRSRYIEQLILTKELNEKRRISIPKINTPFVYKKNTELLIENQNTNISHFSPTHLDDYINCPYKFYLRYVKEIKP
ncbi:MAG: hypothetical protein N3C60_10085, partial [Calditerrivibrio sp.]|nr:hypothetical protein [Calditerrivibrio sp.]